ncbi:aldo/keto reductase [Psittacicella gerlachiana]|uniref:2,5-diketo-D-gluconic acid reductase n=1 Tax=Psittacicella gerlachiana TaxID=2028574 RepID=A0A3A1YJC8_9GAMM|nr:aldo/keto reductase [Psittacicella gerlachiana]RIY37546.1 2,5-diketo-D-gluconic acid reductase [Psittacicella gerlachiana]
MQKIKLNNGIEMPLVGLGVYKMETPGECEKAIITAIEAGYRHIDTATIYGNEKAVGRAIKNCGIPREELFITTKLWANVATEKQAPQAFARSLENLGLDYLDLYLLHTPFNDVFGAWRALEHLYAQGDVRAIGVSNFDPATLQNLILGNQIKPAVNQIELHPFYQQEQAIAFHEQQGIVTESWSSFARGKNDLFSNPILLQIAQEHQVSVAQVVLRWLVQRNIAVIPKSVTPSRIQSNIDLFGFNLSAEQMQLIASLNENHTYFNDRTDPQVVVDTFNRFIPESQ